MQATARFLACEAKEKLRSSQSGWRIEACRRRKGLILGKQILLCGLTQCAAVFLGQARLQLILSNMAVRSTELSLQRDLHWYFRDGIDDFVATYKRLARSKYSIIRFNADCAPFTDFPASPGSSRTFKRRRHVLHDPQVFRLWSLSRGFAQMY